MAIIGNENADNYSRLQAVGTRLSRLIHLEEKWRQAQFDIDGETVAIPAATINALKSKAGTIRNEMKTLLDNLSVT